MKKSKVLSLLTAGAMCVAMLPMSALAATPGAPTVTSATIADAVSTADSNGNLYLTVPSNLQLAGKTFNLTTSEAVSFEATTEATNGQLYASAGSDTSATLRFQVSGFNSEDYSISLTSTDSVNWTGAFGNNFNGTMSALGQAMNYTNGTLRAGTMVDADEVGNDTWNIYSNSDAAYTQLVICDPDSTLATVTYNYGSGSYTWTLPVGASLPEITVPGNLSVLGWYTDSNCTAGNEVNFSTATVTGNITIYADLDEVDTSSNFLTELQRGDTILHIQNAADFTAFANNSSQVTAGKRVVLTEDINLNNASYTAIAFGGDFDGQGHTISNATFTSNGNYAGMFANLASTQKVVNLNLDNITVSGSMFNTSNYSGVLAGQIYGINETPRENCMIQNVHVTNSSVTGYTCGGLVGFSFACTIQYCSVEDTSVTGLANAGGISGLTYGDINACYTDGMTLTALQSRGRGGIVGKLLQSGKITNCFYDYSPMYGEEDQGSEDHNLRIESTTTYWDLLIWIGSQSCWSLDDVSYTNAIGFDSAVVTYKFPTAE